MRPPSCSLWCDWVSLDRRERFSTYSGFFSKILSLYVVLHSPTCILDLPSGTPPREPHILRLRRCHHHRTHHRCGRRIQRSRAQLASGKTQRSPHYHRRKNARAPSRTRERRGSRADPGPYCSLCEQATADEPWDQAHYDRYHRVRG
jgi:hypothetical protein